MDSIDLLLNIEAYFDALMFVVIGFGMLVASMYLPYLNYQNIKQVARSRRDYDTAAHFFQIYR
jgi:hypothetical protein